jgi:hypothetical protein
MNLAELGEKLWTATLACPRTPARRSLGIGAASLPGLPHASRPRLGCAATRETDGQLRRGGSARRNDKGGRRRGRKEQLEVFWYRFRSRTARISSSCSWHRLCAGVKHTTITRRKSPALGDVGGGSRGRNGLWAGVEHATIARRQNPVLVRTVESIDGSSRAEVGTDRVQSAALANGPVRERGVGLRVRAAPALDPGIHMGWCDGRGRRQRHVLAGEGVGPGTFPGLGLDDAALGLLLARHEALASLVDASAPALRPTLAESRLARDSRRVAQDDSGRGGSPGRGGAERPVLVHPTAPVEPQQEQLRPLHRRRRFRVERPGRFRVERPGRLLVGWLGRVAVRELPRNGRL